VDLTFLVVSQQYIGILEDQFADILEQFLAVLNHVLAELN
jgi:hypothetical protein